MIRGPYLWETNKNWYTVKTNKYGTWIDVPKLTSEAPPEAIESYKQYLKDKDERKRLFDEEGIIIS